MDFYNDELVKANPKVKLPDFSTAQIRDLVNLCEGTLRKLGKVDMMGKEFCNDVNYNQYTNNDVSSTSSTSKDTDNLSTPTSDTSIGEFTKEFGLDYLNSEEIDRIWLQMLSQNQQQQNQQINYGTPQPNLQQQQQQQQQQQPVGTSGPYGQPQREYGMSSVPNWQGGAVFNPYDVPVTPGFVTNGGLDDINLFDFFNDLPLDQVFSS